MNRVEHQKLNQPVAGVYVISVPSFGCCLFGADISVQRLVGAGLIGAYHFGASLIGANQTGASHIGANPFGARGHRAFHFL